MKNKKYIFTGIITILIIFFSTICFADVRPLNSQEVRVDNELFMQLARDSEELDKYKDLSQEQKNLIDTLEYKIKLLETESSIYNERISLKDEIIGKYQQKEDQYIIIENESRSIIKEQDIDITKLKYSFGTTKIKGNLLIAILTGTGVALADGHDRYIIGGVGLASFLLFNK
jgi:hypothetical protein